VFFSGIGMAGLAERSERSDEPDCLEGLPKLSNMAAGNVLNLHVAMQFDEALNGVFKLQKVVAVVYFALLQPARAAESAPALDLHNLSTR
jgi:hypothetical protein